MIQLQFSSVKNVVHSLPLVPSSSATSSSANIPTAPILRINNHRRRGQFTAKIIKHGGATRDTSIHAASKSKQREKIQYEKSIGSLDEMMEEFEKEREEIHKLQETIMKNEKILAKNLLKWYAALSIQMKWRSYYSKRILLRLKAARLITRWAKFRHYYRKLCRAASVINRRVKTLMARRRYLKFIKYHRAAKIIQRNIRKKLDWFHWLFSIFKLSRMKRFIDHILLFGGRRAIKFITDGTKKQQEARIVGRAFLRSCARRRRLKMLRGPQGKIAFYVLSRFYVSNSAIPHNKVMEYLRRRVLTQEDKTRRRVNLSMKQVSELNMKSKTGNKGKQQASPKQGGGGYLSPIQQQQERQLQQQLLQQQQQQEQYYQSQAALFTINDLPPYFDGIYAPRGVADVMLLIQDLYQVALQNPTYLDDSIVPTHPSSTSAPTATSPGGRKGRQREGQMANPKHLLSVASAASTTLSSNSGSGKMKGIGRSTSSEEQGEVITARTSLTGPSPSTSIRHPTTYNQASSGGNHPKNKFVKKDTMVAHHGSSNHSEITSHLASFTPAPPNSTRNTEISRSPRGRLTGAVSNRTPILRGSTASEGMRSMIMDIVEDDEDESPKTVKRNESINTDTSDEDEDESKKGTIGSRSGSPKDQFDTEKPLQMGKSFTAKSKHDNLGNTPMTTPRTTQLDGNTKVHGSSNKQPSKSTNNSASNTTTKRQSVLQKDHHQGTTSKPSNAGTSQKRMSKPVNKPAAAIIANIPPLSLMTPKTDSNDDEQLRFPAIRTPPLNPLLHPGESASSPLNSWAAIENSELMNDMPLMQVPMANTLNSTMSSTLVYSESEDESSPFKDMKGKRFSNSSLPAPNALFAVTDSLPVENSVTDLSSLPKDDSKEAEKDDFVSDVLSPSGTSLLQFDIPETMMVELLGTGYHLEGKE